MFAATFVLINLVFTFCSCSDSTIQSSNTSRYFPKLVNSIMKGWMLNFSLLVLFAAAVAIAQGFGRGFGPGMGMGGGGLMMGGGPNSGQGGDYAQVFHALLSAHQSIKRTVQPTNKGISSLTESNNPRVARLIQLHVEQMRQLL